VAIDVEMTFQIRGEDRGFADGVAGHHARVPHSKCRAFAADLECGSIAFHGHQRYALSAFLPHGHRLQWSAVDLYHSLVGEQARNPHVDGMDPSRNQQAGDDPCNAMATFHGHGRRHCGGGPFGIVHVAILLLMRPWFRASRNMG